MPMFQDMIQNFLLGWLPFNIILQIFILFINEGIKIFYRVMYRILKNSKNYIFKTTDPLIMQRVIREHVLNLP